MFGRRKRQETEELLDAASRRLDASAKQAAALVDAVVALNATISTEMERNQRLEAASEAAARALQQAIAAQTTDVSGALRQVASMYELLAGRIDDDRQERRAISEAIGRLALPPAPPAEPPRPRVLGGSVFATPPGDAREVGRGDAVELVPGAPFTVGTAVCCRFGDQWIDGVEIVEVLGNPARPSYRLRRTQDGYVLPPSFGSRDLRLASCAPPAETGTEPRGRWARS